MNFGPFFTANSTVTGDSRHDMAPIQTAAGVTGIVISVSNFLGEPGPSC